MRTIELPKITIDGEEYPIYCDLFVLSKIQEKMDLNDFEREILGVEIMRDKDGEPVHDENGRIRLKSSNIDINTLLMGLALMVNEGLLIDAEQTGKEYEPVDEKYLGRVCDVAPIKLSNMVHQAFGRCLESKKKEPMKSGSRKKNTSK